MWGHEDSMGGHEGSMGGSCGAMGIPWGILGNHGGTMREQRFIHHRMDPLACIYLIIFFSVNHIKTFTIFCRISLRYGTYFSEKVEKRASGELFPCSRRKHESTLKKQLKMMNSMQKCAAARRNSGPSPRPTAASMLPANLYRLQQATMRQNCESDETFRSPL